ncbi:MAG: LamB/YcsF family protein, partial [Cyanobacteria bacterium]|nr:LamB/YcsF family protein [Cyanobacteriota bacterium]
MPKTYEIAKKVILNPRLKRYIDVNTDFAQQPDKKFFEGEKNQLLTYVSSVNMPCCVHDGDPKQIMDDIIVAKSFNCAVGAHIAYPDPVNLGYKEMNLSPEELVAWIHVQMGAFRALCLANGIDVE